MSKKFKVKAVFLCLLVLIISAFALLPKEPLKAETSKSEVAVYYALLTLGYSDTKDKNSLVVEEYIGVDLNLKGLEDKDHQTLKQNIFAQLKSYKISLDFIINSKLLATSIITTDAQIDGSLIYVKVRYLNLPAYYLFNGREIPSENSSPAKPYDSYEKGLFYNKYNIVLNNPYGTKGSQTTLNLFRDTTYQNILDTVSLTVSEFDKLFVFDYSSNDDRLYGDYKGKYNIAGLNNNTLYVYQFVFKDDIPETTGFYFVMFNQYMWYVVAIAVTLIVVGVLFIVVFIKGRKEKKNIIETQKNSQNDENLLNISEK